MREPCFVCGKKLGRNPPRVKCEDDQLPFVGSECIKRVVEAGTKGFLTSRGPKVYSLSAWQELHGVKFNFNLFPRNGLTA